MAHACSAENVFGECIYSSSLHRIILRNQLAAMPRKNCAPLTRPTATFLVVVAFSVIHLSRCIDAQLAEPTHEMSETDSWLKRQGDCSQFYTSRRFITGKEVALLSAGTPDTSSSSSSSHAADITAKGQHDNSSWCPAVLWTYTGTGNTMTRMLIEAASGWYTGSVYTDLSLVDILPGEYVCDSRVIAVKAHPQWHSFSSLSPGGFTPDMPHVPPDAKPICPCAYDRAVAVIRDPFATFLAEYKRLRTHDYDSCSDGLSDGSQPCQGGHVSVIKKADFNKTDFRVEVMRMAHEWAAMFHSYDAFAAAHPHGFYLTTFEALTSPSTRLQALRDLLKVLGVPPQLPVIASNEVPMCQGGNTQCKADDGAAAATAAVQAKHLGCQTADAGASFRQEQQPQAACAAGVGSDALHSAATAAAGASVQEGYNEGRLQCAFQLARHPLIYRPKDAAGIDAEYVYGGDVQLVCDVWNVVGARAAAHGYSVYGGVQC